MGNFAVKLVILPVPITNSAINDIDLKHGDVKFHFILYNMLFFSLYNKL